MKKLSSFILHPVTGKRIGLVSTGILMPDQTNHLRIQFGGEVLKKFDELSGELAGLYCGSVVHASELVIFSNPLFVGKPYEFEIRVIFTTDRFVVLLVLVRDAEHPDTLCYGGFATCAKIDGEGKSIADVPPFDAPAGWTEPETVALAREYFELQKKANKHLRALLAAS